MYRYKCKYMNVYTDYEIMIIICSCAMIFHLAPRQLSLILNKYGNTNKQTFKVSDFLLLLLTTMLPLNDHATSVVLFLD